MFGNKDSENKRIAKEYLTGKARELFSSQAVHRSLDNIENHKAIQETTFEYLIIEQDASSDLKDLPIVISKIIKVISLHRFYLGEIVYPMFFCYAGLFGAETDLQSERELLATDLLHNFNGQIRILHGRCKGFAGYLPTLTWGNPIVCMPQIGQSLNRLFSLRFGECSMLNVGMLS